MDFKMVCLQAQTGCPSSHFLKLGGSFRKTASQNESRRPFLDTKGPFQIDKWLQRRALQWQPKSMAGDTNFSSSAKNESEREPNQWDTSSFCIIEGPETIQDFAKMQLEEIEDNVKSRRNKIFLLMEEVRRLRVQQRIKRAERRSMSDDEGNEMPDIPSSIPFLPYLTPSALTQFYATSFSFIAGIIVFGGLLAPSLELKLGLGGTSYGDFIHKMHLPLQLSQVDPIVASFSGGAVGVISALMVVAINNVQLQEKKRCKYCRGTGYLVCARCSNTGALVVVDPISIVNGFDSPLLPPKTERCPSCSGVGKVMCPTCLCTGMAMASEHDPRIDPFD